MEQTQFSMKQKIIAIILVICFMVTLIPEFAVESHATTVTDENILSEEEVTKEDIIEKTETTTTYDLGGDQKMTVMHGGSVRYKDEAGDLVDYDPSLLKIEKGDLTTQEQSLDGYSYTNKDGDKKHYLPQRLSEDTPIRMEYQDYAIEFSLTEKSLEQTGTQKDTVQVEKDTVQTAYEDFAKLPVKAVYGDVNEGAVLTYTSTEDGVKETWTFNEKPDSNVIRYRLDLTGMTARKNVTDGGITYYDRETGDIIGAIESPWMNDATGNAYSENIQYELDTVNADKGEYLLTMTVDEEYLNDSSRVYPITIDPTNTWRGDSEVKDVYVISGSKYGDTNFYESGTTKMPSGKNDTGTHRTYIKFINLKTITKGYSVGSAKFTVYETGTGASKQSIGAYRVTESWTTSKLTYNNRPTSSTCYDTITTQKTAKTAHTFDLTKFAKAVADETITNYGIQLYNKTSDPSYACFHGSRASSYKPKLVVTYYSVPTKASSVSLSASATKKSSNVKLTFSGITGDATVTKKYKIQKYNIDTWKDTSYSGTATSGMSLPSLSDGTYRVAVWGVNKAGVSGSKAYSGKLLVDSVATIIGINVTFAYDFGYELHHE